MAADLETLDPSPPDRSVRVLVVDDQNMVRRAIARVLELYGFEVVEATSVAEALAALEADLGIEVVLSDLCMPEGDGVTLLSQAHARRPELPFVLMSAYVADDDFTRATEHGAVAVLSKPVAPDLLLAVLRRAARHSLEPGVSA